MSVLATFLVLAVELDGGLVALADRRITLGADVCHPALQSVGSIAPDGAAVTLEAQALPDWARDSWWINREAMLIECAAADQSIYDGTVCFDGIIGAQPNDEAGIWSLALVPPRRRVRPVPDYGLITATDWPLATDAAMGQPKPMVVGEVDACPLLPVQVPAWTTLAVPAVADTTFLEVADTADLAASGSVIVDGVTYTYTDKSATALLGMAITRRHAAGTLVSQAGSTVYLAAGHAVDAITDIRADGARIDGGTADLAAATVTFPAPPSVVSATTRYTLTEHFDAVHASNTASNAVNAIRAAINSYSQTGTPSGAVTAAAPGSISFSRPADGYRIIAGAYAVQFSVAVASQVGWARVKIGNDLVWYWEPGLGVVYDGSPCAITLDDDTDALPVIVEVADGGSDDQVTVTIVTASRSIVTGNLDEANFATVAPGKLLAVTQSDTPPDRGRIAAARLVVRWFATDGNLGATAVSFGGVSLGELDLTATAGTSMSHTVYVNSIDQGFASLPLTPISTSVSGGTASLSHLAVAKQASITPPVLIDVGAGMYRALAAVPSFDGWDSSIGTITWEFVMSATSAANAETKYASAWVEFINAAGGTSGGTVTTGVTRTIVAGQAYAITRYTNFAPAALRFGTLGYTGTTYPLKSVMAAWNGRITSGALNISNTPASGSSNPVPANMLVNSGISVGLANGQINFSTPSPPRVVNTVFPLSGYADWADFAGKVATVSLTGTGASLCVVETYLQIDYDELTHAPASTVTATVTGLDGNPAAVIALLAAASDESVDLTAKLRLQAWCSANGLAFARRLPEPTDALTLLTYAAEQSGVYLARWADRLTPVRWMDLAGAIVVITDADLLAPARIGWADRVENAITLRYAEDYATDAGFTRVAQATAATTTACRKSAEELAETREQTIEAGWLRTDAAAAVALGQHVARHARPRRTAALQLPFSFELDDGALIEYDTALWRITGLTNDQGWLDIAAEEVLT